MTIGNFMVWMPTLCQGARSKLFLWTLPFNPYKRTLQVRFFERRFWDEDAQAGRWGLTLVEKRDSSRSGQTEKLGCSTVLQAPAALAGCSEAGRPCRVVLKYREGAGVSCVDPLLGGVYPLSKGCMTLCSWGLCLESCHCEMTPSTASITQTDDTNA